MRILDPLWSVDRISCLFRGPAAASKTFQVLINEGQKSRQPGAVWGELVLCRNMGGGVGHSYRLLTETLQDDRMASSNTTSIEPLNDANDKAAFWLPPWPWAKWWQQSSYFECIRWGWQLHGPLLLFKLDKTRQQLFMGCFLYCGPISISIHSLFIVEALKHARKA